MKNSGPVSWIWRQISAAGLALGGWKVEGDWPDAEKAVLVAAPHTSNWDGLWMLGAAGYYRVKLRWMGKASLVRHPLGWFVRWLGCVPVDRTAAKDTVDQMAQAFSQEQRLILAIAPEGTRSATRGWKSGFYRIAIAANVPLLITILDYGSRTIKVAGLFQPTGDYDADLPRIQAYYAEASGLHEDNFNLGDGTD